MRKILKTWEKFESKEKTEKEAKEYFKKNKYKLELIDEIVEKVKADSKRIVAEPRTFSWIFLLAALVLFLIEVAVRRIQEGKRQ